MSVFCSLCVSHRCVSLSCTHMRTHTYTQTTQTHTQTTQTHTGAGFNTLPSSNRASEVARQGGATSGAITGWSYSITLKIVCVCVDTMRCPRAIVQVKSHAKEALCLALSEVSVFPFYFQLAFLLFLWLGIGGVTWHDHS